MPTIQSTRELFLHNGQFYTLVGGQGALLNAQCEFVRALFVKSADLDRTLKQAPGLLSLENVSLFCITKANRDDMVGFLFGWIPRKQILLDYGATPWATCYQAEEWSELQRDGDWGFLITGPGDNSVWRIVRAEPDHIMRAKLTVTAVFPATGFPQMNFSRVRDSQLRTRIETDWARLQELVANKHGDEAVTASKNILEGLFSDVLESAGQPPGGNLVQKLERLERLLDADPKSVPICKLGLHLAQKIRLLHQRTHPERAVSLDRQMRPEFMLACVEDLIEILATMGYVEKCALGYGTPMHYKAACPSSSAYCDFTGPFICATAGCNARLAHGRADGGSLGAKDGKSAGGTIFQDG
jgi:hypothetical protein